MRSRALIATLLLMLSLMGCRAHGDASQPVPTAFIPAAGGHAERVLVLLPGRADDLERLRTSGAAEAAQKAWPGTDVVLAEVTMEYYLQRAAEQRLHDEIVAPLRKRGYREIWMGGASMGGMGTLLYDRTYPGQLDGMVLLAPYLGGRKIHDEIRAAGGLAAWNPGPPQPMTPETWEHELWRYLHDLSSQPARTRQLWLAYGDHDRLREAMPLIEPLVPAGQVRVLEGGHTWSVWTPALHDVMKSARQNAVARSDAR